MYCKICGNLLNKDDKICKACGSEVVEETPIESIKHEPILEKEAPAVIFNPPYREEQKNEKLEEEKKESRIGKPDTGEFSWDVYDFPKPAKAVTESTEKPRFNWSSQELEEASRVQKEARARAQADFRARTQPSIRDGSFTEPIPAPTPTPIPTPASIQQPAQPELVQPKPQPQAQPTASAMAPFQTFDAHRYAPKEDADEIITKSDIEAATINEFQAKGIETSSANDKFFTFSKKNEEFQRLLDKEYARINGIEEPKVPTPPIVQQTPLENPVASEPVIIPGATVIPEPAVVTEKPLQGIPVQNEYKNISSIDEMEAARKSFFGNPIEEEIVLDNDTIKQRYDTLEVLRNDLKGKVPEDGTVATQPPAVETPVVDRVEAPGAIPKPVAAEQIKSATANGQVVENNEKTPLESENAGIKQGDYSYFDHADEPEEEQNSGIAAKIVLVVIVLLLIAELAILGIKYFMPDSQATAFILDKEILIVETVSNWISKIKGIF